MFQTGAWILADDRPLSRELQTFLDNFEPPIYFGFGSTRASEGGGLVMLEAARSMGRRAIVSRGWLDGSLVDNEADCLSIGEVNVHALFPRVVAVVHHGGARRQRRSPVLRKSSFRVTKPNTTPNTTPNRTGTSGPAPRRRNRARTGCTDHRLIDTRS